METITQTAGRDALGGFAPEFAHFNDDVLFGENWNNRAISHKTRCIITVVALMSSGITDSSLRYHLENAKAAGVTREEIAAVVTHTAFYAGWPKGWAVFNMAKDVWNDEEGEAETVRATDTEAGAPVAAGAPVETRASAGSGTPARAPIEASSARAAHAASMVFPIGEPNDAFAQYFTGRSYLAPVSAEQVGVFNVTFEPGCRNNWHVHRASAGGGQVLVCVAGRGWYQEWGKPAVELTPGSCVNIPAGVKHWHGAARDSWFSHLAFEVPGEGCENEWLESVTDEQYETLK